MVVGRASVAGETVKRAIVRPTIVFTFDTEEQIREFAGGLGESFATGMQMSLELQRLTNPEQAELFTMENAAKFAQYVGTEVVMLEGDFEIELD